MNQHNPAYDLLPEREEVHTTDPKDCHDIRVKLNSQQDRVKEEGKILFFLPSGDTKQSGQGYSFKRSASEVVDNQLLADIRK